MEKIAPAKQISESRAPTTKYPHGFRNKNQQRTTILIPERKTPTFKNSNSPTRRKTTKIRQDPKPPPTTQGTGCSTTTRALRTCNRRRTRGRRREVGKTCGSLDRRREGVTATNQQPPLRGR
ncbi:hypothetical protein P8452_07536 [Trifolium repens]|nr:hypothetical protein P8452_07536 [Trifolium repens]